MNRVKTLDFISKLHEQQKNNNSTNEFEVALSNIIDSFEDTLVEDYNNSIIERNQKLIESLVETQIANSKK